MGLSVENRIRDLAAKAVSASEEESNQLLDELRSAIHEHANQTRAIMRASYPKKPTNATLEEAPSRSRRKSNEASRSPKKSPPTTPEQDCNP